MRITNNVETIIQEVSPLFGVGAGAAAGVASVAAALVAAGAGATTGAVASGAGADTAAVPAVASGTAVSARAKVPAPKKLKPSARDKSIFFMVLFLTELLCRFRRYECGQLVPSCTQISFHHRSCRYGLPTQWLQSHGLPWSRQQQPQF